MGGKLTGTDATYVYDGNAYTVAFEFEPYPSDLEGYIITYTYDGEIPSTSEDEVGGIPKFTEVGEYPITATVSAYVGETETEITFEATATLTITAVPMTIIIDDKTMKYGETVPDFTWTVTSDSKGNTIPSAVLGAFKNFALNATKTTDTVAVGANTYTVNMTPVVNDSPLNAGTYAITTAKDDIKILDAGTEIATSNFVITVIDGTLTVDKRNVVLTSASASKQYDGTALTEGTVTTSEDGFAEGEGVAITVTGTQTEEGTSDNTFTYALNDGTLPENYNITTVFGTLTITAAPTDDTVTQDDDDDDDDDVVDADDDDDDDDDTTTTSNDNGPSDDGTTTITDAPTPLAATPQGAVLGANRDNTQTTDGAAVLGARRGGTSDSTNVYRIYILIVAAGIAVSLTILGVIARRKEEEE